MDSSQQTADGLFSGTEPQLLLEQQQNLLVLTPLFLMSPTRNTETKLQCISATKQYEDGSKEDLQ